MSLQVDVKNLEIRRGALVFTPPPGIHKGVVIFDFSRFYPSILLAFNISLELIHLPEKERLKAPLGITPLLCQKLIKDRNYYEDILLDSFKKYGPDSDQYKIAALAKTVTKFRLNAVFGDGLYPKSRFYDEVGMSLMLQIARSLLVFLKDICKKYGWKFIYGDTDSVMIIIPEDKILEAEKILQDEINKQGEELGIRSGEIVIKAEKFASIAVFLRKKGSKEGAKKKYIMRIIKEFLHGTIKIVDYPYIKGLDLIRGNTAKISKDIQRDLIDALFEDRVEEEIANITEKIVNLRNDVYRFDDIAISMNLGRKLEDYVGNPEHVKAVRYANKELKTNIRKGDRFKMLFIEDIPNRKRTEVLAYQEEHEIPKGTRIDKGKTIDRLFYKKVETLIEAMGFSLEDLKGMKDLASAFI